MTYRQPAYGRPTYGQPPYGEPGGYPPGPGGPGGPGFGPYGPPPSSSKTPWIIGAIAVAVVAGIVAALVLTLGGSGNSSDGAKAAVVTLLKADVNKDLKSAQNITCDPPGLPTGGGTGSFCITPNGSTPICIPN
jgi:hypothetical protein